MAEGKGAPETADLLPEITCSLCLDIFQDPKRLPCDHVYCKSCLEGVARHSSNGAISCPECRHVAQVVNDDIATTFPTAFQINRLKEMYDKQQQDIIINCQIHQKPFVLYCETCTELMCVECIVAAHGSHTYQQIPTSAEKYRKCIEDRLESQQKAEVSLSSSLAKVTETKNKTLAQEEVLNEEIDDMFEILFTKLSEEKSCFKKKVSDAVHCEAKKLTIQENALQNAHAVLSSAVRSAQHACRNLSDVHLLFQQDKIIQKLECSAREIGKVSLEPVDVSNIGCRTMTPQLLESTCRSLNTIFSKANPRKCIAEGQGLKLSEIDKLTTVRLHLADNKGNASIDMPPIEVQLTNIKHSTSIVGEVTQKHMSYYDITYLAPVRGRHSLSIKVNGYHILGSPFPVYVRKPPQTFTDPVTSKSNLCHPGGLAWNNERLYVCEHNAHRILVFDHTLNLVKTISHPLLKSPTELTVDKALNVFVSTCRQNQVHKFNKDGEHLKHVGEFHFANGMRMSTHGDVYLCDTNNSRIQVYDTDLRFKRSIKLKNKPYDIEFDNSGNMYISCADIGQIQVLSTNEKPTIRIGKKGSKPDELSRPVGLQIFDNLLYITDYKNNRVSVFHTSGKFVTVFGESYLTGPEGIAIDEDGYVYVTSHCKHVLVF